MTKPTPKKKFHELLETMDTAMLTTRAVDGRMKARPMMLAEASETGVMKFISAIDSEKVAEITRDPSVAVSFQAGAAFLSVTGAARIEQDPQELKRLWKPQHSVWFEGPEDPTAALIVVTPVEAEYWDQRGVNGLRYAFEVVRSMITGDPPRADDDQHGNLLL